MVRGGVRVKEGGCKVECMGGEGGHCREGGGHACSVTSSQARRVMKMHEGWWQGDGGSRATAHHI